MGVMVGFVAALLSHLPSRDPRRQCINNPTPIKVMNYISSNTETNLNHCKCFEVPIGVRPTRNWKAQLS